MPLLIRNGPRTHVFGRAHARSDWAEIFFGGLTLFTLKLPLVPNLRICPQPMVSVLPKPPPLLTVSKLAYISLSPKPNLSIKFGQTTDVPPTPTPPCRTCQKCSCDSTLIPLPRRTHLKPTTLETNQQQSSFPSYLKPRPIFASPFLQAKPPFAPPIPRMSAPDQIITKPRTTIDLKTLQSIW